MIRVYTLHNWGRERKPLTNNSLNYSPIPWPPSTTHVQLDILLNGTPVDAMATIVHRDKAYTLAKSICIKLRDAIDR